MLSFSYTATLSYAVALFNMNSLFAIAPYKFQGFWVFDDPAVGLKQEPFVSGADTIIDVLTADIPNAESGFKLVFSPQPFRVTPRASNGSVPKWEAIGMVGPSATWKAGYVRPYSNISM